jgi:DNA polymerase-1
LKKKTLLLIDGHGLAFRAFYALPMMNAPDGTPTNAVLGFANMYLKVLNDLSPDGVAVCFDSAVPSFRKALFAEYKEGRQPTPESFKPQIPLVKQFLELIGCPVLEQDGVEADDLLATITEKSRLAGWDVVLLTADKDFLQLLKPGVTILKPVKGISEFEKLDEDSFKERFGFPPVNFTTWLSLTGDSVDNIPGVPGIGEKTASTIVSKFPTLEIILQNLQDLPARTAEKILTRREQLELNLTLVALKEDLPFELEQLSQSSPRNSLLADWMRNLGFKQLARRLNLETRQQETVARSGQGSLDLGENLSSAAASSLEQVLATPPFGLSFTLEKLPARNFKIVSACLASSSGAFAIFGPENPLAVPLIETVLEKGEIFLSGLKEFCSATGWKPANFERIFDIRVGRYLLHPERQADLPDEEHFPLEKKALGFLAEASALSESVKSLGLDFLARRIDMPLAPVLSDIERHGIGVDTGSLIVLGEALRNRTMEIASSIFEATGVTINLNSPQQVASLLFERLGLDVQKTKKTGPSTDSSVLESLASDPVKGHIPALILEHREVSKLFSSFVETFQKCVEPSTGSVHSTFDPLSTATGRLSSKDPNVQNLPQFGEWAGRFRKCLVPRHRGWKLLSADYSQIELRVLAHLCGDAKLRGAFESGRDIHTETASWVFNVNPSLVTPDLRRAAKAVNFGLLYGMSSHGLAQRLGLGRNEAKSIIDRYFSALPSVREYLEDSVSEAIKRGHTRSLFGRIRPLSEISTANGRGYDAVRRIALNTPIQSTAADIAKLAMIAYSRTPLSAEGRHPLVLQVHDSLVCECPESEIEQAAETLRKSMENAVSLSIPLTVEIKGGDSFASI